MKKILMGLLIVCIGASSVYAEKKEKKATNAIEIVQLASYISTGFHDSEIIPYMRQQAHSCNTFGSDDFSRYANNKSFWRAVVFAVTMLKVWKESGMIKIQNNKLNFIPNPQKQ